MKISILGAGASGVYAAILLKKKHPDYEVVLFDKEDKALRKMRATGNGHCNLLNSSLSPDKFNNSEFIGKSLLKYPFSFLKKTLESWGVRFLNEGDYYYPLTYSAPAFSEFLISLASSLGVRFSLSKKIANYSETKAGVSLFFGDGSEETADLLLIACGGASTPNLGSDGSFFSVLNRRGYGIVPLKPGLTSLKLSDSDLSPLSGIRHDAEVSLFVDGKRSYSERGEILYKDKGISGIVIFNLESKLYREPYFKKAHLEVDLFPDYSLADLSKEIVSERSLPKNLLLSPLLQEPLKKHVLSRMVHNDIATCLKGLRYEISGNDGFAHSQVSLGGVRVNEVDETLRSVMEPNVFFIGEALDIDGFCGGYNLSWALISALMASEGI